MPKSAPRKGPDSDNARREVPGPHGPEHAQGVNVRR